MSTLASGSIDLNGAKIASETASNYLTDVTDGGVYVHSADTPSDPSSDTAKGVKITDQIDIIRNGDSVAAFGESARIGSSWEVLVNSSSVDIIDGDRELPTARFDSDGVTFYDGNGTESSNITAEFGTSGAIIGSEASTSRAKITSDGFEIEDNNLLNIVQIGKGETLVNHYNSSTEAAGYKYLNQVFLSSDQSSGYKSKTIFNLASPTGEITVDIPWKRYTSQNRSATLETGIFTCQFTGGVADTKVDDTNSLQVTYSPAQSNRMTLQCIGSNLNTWIREYLSKDILMKNMRSSYTLLSNLYQDRLLASDYIAVYFSMHFSQATSTNWSGSVTFSCAHLPTGGASRSYSVSSRNYTVKFTLLCDGTSSSMGNRYRITAAVTSKPSSSQTDYGYVILSTDTYITHKLDGVIIDTPVSVDYYGTSEAPFYSFGQRIGNTNGAYSLIAGQGLTSAYPRNVVFGKYNSDSEDGALQIGNGTDEENRANIFKIDWNGNVNAAGTVISDYSKANSTDGGYSVTVSSLAGSTYLGKDIDLGVIGKRYPIFNGFDIAGTGTARIHTLGHYIYKSNNHWYAYIKMRNDNTSAITNFTVTAYIAWV